jgi:fucose permease
VADRRLAAATAFAGLFAFAVVISVTPAAINEIGRSYRASASVLGALYLVQAGGFFVAVITGGRASDRRGKLPVVTLGSLLMGAGAAGFALSRSLPLAFVALTLTGVGGGLTEGIAMAAVSDLYTGRRRTAMLNWAQAVFAFGAISGPMAVSGLIRAGAEWRVGYFGTAAVCAAAAVLGCCAVWRRSERAVAADQHAGWREFLADPLVLWLSIGIMLYVGAESGQANWLAAYFERVLGSRPAFAASTIALFWVGISLGRVAATWLSRHMSDYGIICWALGLSAAFQVGLLAAYGPAVALVCVVGLGWSLGPVWPTILSRAGAAHPGQSGTVFGVIVAAGAAGFAIFPPAIGRAADWVGLGPALWLCPVLLAVNLVIFARLRWRLDS